MALPPCNCVPAVQIRTADVGERPPPSNAQQPAQQGAAPQPQTSVVSNPTLPSHTTSGTATPRSTLAGSTMHGSPAWGVAEAPQRTVVNARDSSQRDDGMPDLRRVAKKKSGGGGSGSGSGAEYATRDGLSGDLSLIHI